VHSSWEASAANALATKGLILPGQHAIQGLSAGAGLAQLLVQMLTQVFGPRPEALVAPWAYLALLGGAAAAATTLAVLSALVATRRSGGAAHPRLVRQRGRTQDRERS